MQDGSSSAGIATRLPGAPRDHWYICIFVLLLFCLSATVSALRKDVRHGFDEVAHTSYVAHIQKTGEVWPKFDDMRVIDPATFRFVDNANYLNHPPIYYGLLAALGPKLEGHPDAILVHRLLNVALAAIGLAALMLVGLAVPLPRLSLYAYVIPLACIPVLVPLAGAITNDNLAFAGGGIATFGLWRLLAVGGRASLLIALVGLVVASWGKLTGLLLVGGMAGVVLLWLLWRGRFQAWWIAPIAIAGILAIAPYVALYAAYGSPAPSTAGQIAMVKAGAKFGGLDVLPRVSPLLFVPYFVSIFVADWMPVLESRSLFNYLALMIPVATLMLASAGMIVSLRRIARRQESTIDVIVVAATFAFTLTFVIHGFFDYRYYVPYGWTSIAPRYYLPLAALVPLACLSLLDAIAAPRPRAVLLGFLIGGPIVFRVLGMPL